MEQITLSWEPERRILAVSELTSALREVLGSAFPDIWVAGEISGTRLAPSGHYYFTLKDADAQLRCACFRNAARHLSSKPRDGLAVLARGRIDVYPPRGEYQLLVEAIEPQGEGALQMAFERLKKKLEAEGLFAPDRKRPLPFMPRRIGVVTSPSGAAIRDMVHVLSRRFAGLHIRLYPALVQGDGSAEAIVEGIHALGDSGWPELIIVGRGGGSLEDLWSFNEESVARAIAACPVPVVSAVGHETDFTIADFVADLRAPTPSAAAELVVPELRAILERIATQQRKLQQATRYRLANARNRLHETGADYASAVVSSRIAERLQQVDDLDYRLRERSQAFLGAALRRTHALDVRLGRQDLRLRLARLRARMDTAHSRCAEQIRLHLTTARARLKSLESQLHPLSPVSILERGYAIVQTPDGRLIREATSVSIGDGLAVRLWRGHVRATVTQTSPEETSA